MVNNKSFRNVLSTVGYSRSTTLRMSSQTNNPAEFANAIKQVRNQEWKKKLDDRVQIY